MKPTFTFHVVPYLPERLSPLRELAFNLHWTWHPAAIALLRRLDEELWEETNHNPVALLGRLNPSRFDDILADEGFLVEMRRVHGELKRYLGKNGPHTKTGARPRLTVAYLSAEFGITDCLPIYSGGLGILAGDYLKSASDLHIPLVGVGLFYQQGYFRQYLNSDGWQLESYRGNEVVHLPLELVLDDHQEPLTVPVPIEDREVNVRVWRTQIGRIPLYLLDTNNLSNDSRDRNITAQLYSGDREVRLLQEMVLGIGGIRMLTKLGILPTCLHMNEGHSAFACLELISLLMRDHGLGFEEASGVVSSTSLFTTHTSVPAGIDVFEPALLQKAFTPYLRSTGISLERLLEMGKNKTNNPNEGFNMAVFALRMADLCNAVSNLHRSISQSMFSPLWPEVPLVDVPIHGITNGVHIPSWISNDMAGLYDRYLGPKWAEDPDSTKTWVKVDKIPDTELWRTHERRRERLVDFCRRRLRSQLERRGASTQEIQRTAEILNPEVLTIGFARRFATYKRGDLLFQDPERLTAVLTQKDRPIQVIFAGKAHPLDQDGKQVIRCIIHFIQEHELRHHIVFIEDYDINVARYLVQGVDVWLNTPRRPMEACGTSGMKAAANGALNLSVLDGWWCEVCGTDVGWTIGQGEEYSDHEYQNQVESRSTYDLLENAIAPLFYDRGRDNIPRGWVVRMKSSLRSLCARFNTHRMLEDYVGLFYLPSAKRWESLSSNEFSGARDFQSWKSHVTRGWDQLNILSVEPQSKSPMTVGEELKVNVRVVLGKITPEDVSVDLYYGPLDSQADFVDRSTVRLTHVKAEKQERHLFSGTIPCMESGKFGFRVRVLPAHPLLINPYSLGLILWS